MRKPVSLLPALALSVVFRCVVPTSDASAEGFAAGQFAFDPGRVERHISLECYTYPIEDIGGTLYPATSISTNISAPSPLGDWDADLTLSLPLPYPPDGSVSVFARAYHKSQFSDYSITGDFGAYGGANYGGVVPGYGQATTSFAASFTVTAEVAYHLEVFKVDALYVPSFDLRDEDGTLTSFPGYPRSGLFTFDGTFQPNKV